MGKKRSELDREDLELLRRRNCADWLTKAALMYGAADVSVNGDRKKVGVERQYTRLLLDFPEDGEGNPAHTMIVELDVLEDEPQ